MAMLQSMYDKSRRFVSISFPFHDFINWRLFYIGAPIQPVHHLFSVGPRCFRVSRGVVSLGGIWRWRDIGVVYHYGGGVSL